MLYHKGVEPWDYEEGEIVALCDKCHELWNETKKQIDFELVMGVHQHGRPLASLRKILGVLTGWKPSVTPTGEDAFDQGVLAAKMILQLELHNLNRSKARAK